MSNTTDSEDKVWISLFICGALVLVFLIASYYGTQVWMAAHQMCQVQVTTGGNTYSNWQKCETKELK